jgi:hypothetical protein
MLLIRDGAEHETGHCGVKARVLERQMVRDSGKHADRDGRALRGGLGLAAQRRLGLDREDLGDLRRVEREVEPVSGADFDDGSLSPWSRRRRWSIAPRCSALAALRMRSAGVRCRSRSCGCSNLGGSARAGDHAVHDQADGL